MNRTDRPYAVVEALRAAGPRGRTARQLADRFEVSVRTIERDLSALGQAGVPLATKQGRNGGFSIDPSMSLPPLNFTAREAAAVAVALSRSGHVLFGRDARSALQKIVAAMPESSLEEARATLARVKRLVQPVPEPDIEVAVVIWRAFRENRALKISYVDDGGVETEREVDPDEVVVGPTGSYLSAWCHLRQDDRVFRLDRITNAVVASSATRVPRRNKREDSRRPATAALRFPELLPKTDIGLSRTPENVITSRQLGGQTDTSGDHHDQPRFRNPRLV